MKLKTALKFILNPKGFVKERVEEQHLLFLKQMNERDFLVSINETKKEDIFIAGFPKSGNTWMQSLVSGLQFGIDTNYLSDQLSQEIVPDVHARLFYKRFGKINFFKTHHLPKPEYKRVIYLVRDGRDAICSYYEFNKKLKVNCTLEEMALEGKHVFPQAWNVHVNEWKKNPYNSDILVIRYEDLVESPMKELKKVCEFAQMERSEGLLQKVIEGNQFDKMKSRAVEFGGLGHSNWKGDLGKDFFRKGKCGVYKSEMPAAVIAEFNKLYANELGLFGYDINFTL